MRATCVCTLGIAICLSLIGGNTAPAVAQAKANQGNLTQFIASDFCVAIVVHPKQIADSPLMSILPASTVVGMMPGSAENPATAKIAQQIDPKKLHRVVVLLDPATFESKTPPGVILQFAEDFDSEAFLKQAFDDLQPGTIEGMPVFTSKKAGQGEVAGAAYVAGSRILVLGPEPVVQKMLATSDAPRPLLEQLKRCNLKSDIVVEVLGQPLAKSFAPATGAESKGMPQQTQMLAGALQDVKSASLQVNLTGGTLLRLTLVGAKPSSADNLYGQLGLLKMMLSQQVRTPRTPKTSKRVSGEGAPPPAENPMVEIGDEILKGLKLRKEDDQVLLSLKMPRDLTGFVQKVMLASMQMGAPKLGEGMPMAVPSEPSAEPQQK